MTIKPLEFKKEYFPKNYSVSVNGKAAGIIMPGDTNKKKWSYLFYLCRNESEGITVDGIATLKLTKQLMQQELDNYVAIFTINTDKTNGTTSS